MSAIGVPCGVRIAACCQASRVRARVSLLTIAFRGDDPLERRQPVAIVGLAGIGVAGLLRPGDLGGKRRRPFRPGEEAAPVEDDDHREGLRLPRLAEDRAAIVLRYARRQAAVRSGRAHPGSR